MTSTNGNRFAVLGEEEEINFADEAHSTATTDSDSPFDFDKTMVDPSVSRSRCMYQVNFKCVKKRGRSLKSKHKSRSGSAVDVELDSCSTPSTLFRSTLASTFTGRTSTLVPLLRSHRPSGRGGGLNGSPTTRLLHGVAPSGTQLDPSPNSALNLLSATDDQFRDALSREGEDTPITELLTEEEVPAYSPGPKDSSLQQAMAADKQVIPPVAVDAPAESTSTASSPVSPTSAMFTHLRHAPASRALSQSTVESTNESQSAAISTQEPDQIHIPFSQMANTSASPKHSSSTIAADQPPVLPTLHDPRQTPANSDTPSTATDNLAISQAGVVTTQPKTALRLHTFRAQLTFGLKPSQKVNVADQFTH
jgi:hypothetical protein